MDKEMTRKDTLGVIVAMSSEMEMLLKEMRQVEKTEANGFIFCRGLIGNREVVAMQCGIGKVNAAVGAITLIERFSPSAVVNTGIAGGTGRGAGILDVVIGRQVGYHDVYCGPGNAPGQVQGMPVLFDCDLKRFGIQENTPGVKIGLIASGDRFVSTTGELAAVLAIQPQAIAVDMESGAIAQVCHIKGVPFLAIRVVSDTPGAENHVEQYLDFWNVAPERAFAALRPLLGA